CSRDQSNHDYW
nr:immunoglobulin heavy chain junction region [Macaca mulatta]MOW99033.1 immunoglobulin heavy chain junction region [Macaca mulatta]MOW99328.1 immunoglobulin heavy chain junction region [Macaca mulatta]MOW99614.1 immunoglobulin heavy chain junction region [Macaca mulatta]MOX00579.1 immunoglobulin heavy chain junction region [Macaca mulatta]